MSELHNRLAHLVNYSSQLIFVSGDTVADQQRTLSDFLSSQKENTEISFVTAASNKQATDYRSAICRQLDGHTVGSFVRPLNQLLSDLSPEAGPYLVCITAADHLEPTFLQELWDWVMQSQQNQQNIHLNIILFGKADWAESSQEWLPSQNSNKPVLLSSQSVNSSGFDVNALEALMANDRSWFNFSSGPVVSNKWFIGSILSVFFVIFIGLLSWQYPNQINHLLTRGVIEEQSLPAFDIPENTSQKPIISPNKLDFDTTDNTNIIEYTSQLEIVEDKFIDIVLPPAASQATSPESALVNDELPKSKSVTEKLLVRSWQQGISTSEYNAPLSLVNVLQSPLPKTETLQTQTIQAKPVQTESQQTSGPLIVTTTSTLAIVNNNNTDGDFQVPDIISIEQLDQQLDNTLNAQLKNELFTAASINEQAPTSVTSYSSINSSPNTNPANNTPLNAPQSKSSIDYRFDETTLLSLPTDGILLQLSGIQNPVVLENYLASNNLKASTWVYETQRYGGPWYVVLYRQSFDSIDAALNRMSSLPEDVKNAEPFAKSVNQIQQEIRLR